MQWEKLRVQGEVTKQRLAAFQVKQKEAVQSVTFGGRLASNVAMEKKERHCPSGGVAPRVVLSKGAAGVERTVMLFTDCQKLMLTVKLRAP